MFRISTAFISCVCAMAAGSLFNPVYAQGGGRYSVNILQTGASSYRIQIEISATGALEVRTVRLPSILDASEFSGKSDVKALAETKLDFPVRFTSAGAGRLWIAFQSTADSSKVDYLVFDLYSSARGTQVRSSLTPVARLWQDAGTTASIMQFARASVKCGGGIIAGADNSGLMAGTQAVTGVLFAGVAAELDGSISALNARRVGMNYNPARAGRVAFFVSSGSLPAERTAEVEVVQQPETKPESKPEPVRDPKNTSNNATRETTRDPVLTIEPENKPRTTPANRTEAKPKPEPPASGPFSGAGAASSIRGLSVNKAWSQDGGGSGHFGETFVRLPQEYGRLKSVSSVTLVVRIEPAGNVPGTGRVFISDERTLQSQGGSGEAWFADRYTTEGELAGEFDTEYEGPVFRFNVSSFVKSRRGEGFFVSVLNLSRTPLNISDIRLEVKGER